MNPFSSQSGAVGAAELVLRLRASSNTDSRFRRRRRGGSPERFSIIQDIVSKVVFYVGWTGFLLLKTFRLLAIMSEGICSRTQRRRRTTKQNQIPVLERWYSELTVPGLFEEFHISTPLVASLPQTWQGNTLKNSTSATFSQ